MRTIRKLGVEGLERRAMLAGNIHAEVNGGVLQITGDDSGNGVSVEQLGEGKYFVSGFSVNGGNTTTNGNANGHVFSGAKSGINVDLNGGPDIFIVSNSAFRRTQLAGQFSGNTAGAIQTSPEAADATAPKVTSRILGNLTVVTDDGNDAVGIGARVGTRDADGKTTAGVVNIDTGSGSDRVVIDRTEAFDDALIKTGAGNDTVSADKVRVGDFLFAELGAGADQYNSDDAHGFHSQILGDDGNDGIHVSNYRFLEEIFLFAGGGAKNVVTANGMSAETISVTSGGGSDRIDIDGSSGTYGTYLIDTGAGNDSVRLGDTYVENLLKVVLGSGQDNLHVEDTTTGDTLLDGGDGEDTYFNEGGNHFGSPESHDFEHSV